MDDLQTWKSGGELPEWCHVYEGLTDAEVDEIEESIIRSQESRSPSRITQR